MPGLARKIVICAAVDGLVLHPLNSRKDQQQQRLTPVRIKYGDASISHAAAAEPSSSSSQPSFEAFGIIGTSLFHPAPNSVALTTARIFCTAHRTTANPPPLSGWCTRRPSQSLSRKLPHQRHPPPAGRPHPRPARVCCYRGRADAVCVAG